MLKEIKITEDLIYIRIIALLKKKELSEWIFRSIKIMFISFMKNYLTLL